MWLLLMTSSSISGCAAGSGNPGCAGFEPITVPAGQWAALPRWVKQEIVQHNETGERNCGWKP